MPGVLGIGRVKSRYLHKIYVRSFWSRSHSKSVTCCTLCDYAIHCLLNRICSTYTYYHSYERMYVHTYIPTYIQYIRTYPHTCNTYIYVHVHTVYTYVQTCMPLNFSISKWSGPINYMYIYCSVLTQALTICIYT